MLYVGPLHGLGAGNVSRCPRRTVAGDWDRRDGIVPLIGRALMAYVKHFGGGLPGERLEIAYLRTGVQPGSVVVDVGGGEGKLANELAKVARLALVLDREQTCLQ